MLLLGPLTAQAARPANDPETVFRSVAQAARIGQAPAPPPGVRDLPWADLSPRGWDARATLRRWTVFQMPHMDKNDPRVVKVAAGIRQEWDLAPTVQPPATTVRLLAFASPLKANAGTHTVSVLLTPYKWNGVEAPVPPANQMVAATLKRQWPTSGALYPVWVTGTLRLDPSATRIGRIAYRMTGATWEPYPYQQHPMPQYQWPR